jgi:hypothetical protein
VWGTTTGKTERIVLQIAPNHREGAEGRAEIAAGVGLKQTTTGDTLASRAPIVLGG